MNRRTLSIKTKIITSVGLAVFGGIFLFGAQTAFAAVRTSTATGGLWTAGSTWVGGVAPANTDSAVIATTGGNSVTIGGAATNAGLTVNSGAVLNFTGAFVLTENGNVVDNGSITGSTGTITMNSNGLTMDGSGSIGSIVLANQNFSFLSTASLTINNDVQSNGRTVTNNGTVTLNNYARTGGTATWTQGTNAVANISGAFTPAGNVTLNATASGNTVNYSGTTQSPKATAYVNLTLDGGSGVKTITTGTSVAGTLSIAPTGTATASIGAGLTITVANLTLGGLGRVNGTWGSTSSTATNKNNTYFAATTGILSVTNDTRATPTLSVTNSPVTYNAAPHSATVTGSVSGTVSNIKYNGSATVPTNAATYAITADFAPTDATSYKSLTAASAGNFIISKATPTLSVTNSPVTYNAAPQSATVAGSVAGTVSNIKYNGSATTPTNAATYAITADFTPTDTTNYNSLTAASAGNFIISKATPTLSVTNSPVAYDGAAHGAAVSASVPGTVSSILTGGSATQTNAGTYAVTANFTPTDTTNYNSLTAASAGNFVISVADQTITFNTLSDKVLGDSDFIVSATASSGLTVSFSSQTTGVCTVSTATVHIITTGTCTIRASQSGNSSYNAAPNVDQSFTINNPLPTTSSISPTSKTVGDAQFTLTVNGTNFVSNSTINFNGSSRTTTYVSATQLTAVIPASDLTIATSSALITVTNPTPGGGISNAQVFTIVVPIDITPPAVTAFTIPATSTTLAVSISTFTATDNVAVTGYLVTEASSTPSVSDSGWTTSAPTTYTFSTQGDKTLYAWAKDAAGNISASVSATTTITLPDTTVPTVTAFAIPATSSTLAISITTFTATDNIGVTGYLLTESSSTPLASATGWTTSAPTTYTFSTQGDKTLYAWAKDAAGNISTSLSATTTITFVEVAPDQMQSLISSGTMVPNGTVASSTAVTFNQDVHVVFGGGTTVTIPVNAVLTAATAADWNQLSGTASVSTVDAPANYTSAGAMQWGLSSVPLTLSQAATIAISVGSSYNGQTLTVFRKEAGATAWTQADTCVISSGVCQFTTTTFSSFMIGVFHAPASSSSSTSSQFVGRAVEPTRVEFSGQAYPKSKLQVFFKSSVNGLYYVIPQAIYNITDNGAFTISYTALLGGDYIFGLQAEDKDGRKTGIRPFAVDLSSQNELVATNLFLVPTIGFARNTVRKGDVLKVIGYGAANNTIEFEIDGQLQTFTAQAGSDGLYQKLITTADYSLGSHTIRVRQKNKNTASGFSYKKTFAVSQLFFPVTDLNGDGKIDISDWSIFLSKWNSKDPAARDQLDLNGDGKVDVSDFSLFIRTLKKK